MKAVFCAVSVLVFSAVAFATAPTFKIETTNGKVVEVTAVALQRAYSDMISTTLNGTYKNEDGSTSIVLPAVMVAGQAHHVAFTGFYAAESASGLCKLRGFSTLVTHEGIGEDLLAPTVILRGDGTPMDTYEGRTGGVYSYRSVTCR